MRSYSELRGWQWFIHTSLPIAAAVLSEVELKPPNHVFFKSIGPFAKRYPVISLFLLVRSHVFWDSVFFLFQMNKQNDYLCPVKKNHVHYFSFTLLFYLKLRFSPTLSERPIMTLSSNICHTASSLKVKKIIHVIVNCVQMISKYT